MPAKKDSTAKPRVEYCDTCGHRAVDHGDRVLGICSAGGEGYMRCDCDNLRPTQRKVIKNASAKQKR